ncbi:MAG: hypothetical protein JWM58_328 [Rhizobium sp.]|nr:hypothetical protein [Rhizobium sp.]
MFVLILTLYTLAPAVNPPVITDTKMLQIEGFKSLDACDAAARVYRNVQEFNVAYRATCIQVQ